MSEQIEPDVIQARREHGQAHREKLAQSLAELSGKRETPIEEAQRKYPYLEFGTSPAAAAVTEVKADNADRARRIADMVLDGLCKPGHERPFVVDLDVVLFDIRALLLEKNQAYGNSALDPIRCFSRADAVEQIKVRIDDKISRLMRGSLVGPSDAHSASGPAAEDVVSDLIGYLILLRIAQRKQG